MTAGLEALTAGTHESGCVIIVDEVGPLEMQGKGWAPALPRLFEHEGTVVLLTVRPALVAAVQERWKFEAHGVWKVDGGSSGSIPEMSDAILSSLHPDDPKTS
jgi:nucleoside-triphosphatase THEP1